MNNDNIIERLSKVDTEQRKAAVERELLLQKAFKSRDVDTIVKAEQYLLRNSLRNDNNNFSSTNFYRGVNTKRKSIIIDPLETASAGGYLYKPGTLSFDVLRAMSRAPVIRAIINTRKDQVADFCKPQPDKYSPGFIIEKRGVGDDDDLTDADKAQIEKLTEFICECGDEANRWDADDFESFVRKIVEDSLSLDQMNFEVIPNRAGLPTQFVAVDAGTIRIADNFHNRNVKQAVKINGYYPAYVQMWQHVPIAEFYPWELCFGTRNPTTSVRSNGYGRSELEDLIAVVTAMLNADAYNSKFFRNGSTASGALLIKQGGGGINQPMLDQFRSDWAAMMQGVQNAHKIPILDADGFEWVNMHINNRDMEFSKFQEYLIKLGCAIYKISPEEVGFPLGGTNRAGLGRPDSGLEERQYSQNKGLKPLLSFVAYNINKYIIEPLTDRKFRFRFVGLDVESAKEEEERLIKAAGVYMTPDEVRKGKKMKPLPNNVGMYPLNNVIMQLINQQQMQQDQQGQQQEEDFNNTNPFLDQDDEGDNPFTKSFDQWVGENLLTNEHH